MAAQSPDAFDIPDALDALIGGYVGFFETMTALGGALFAANLFLVVRAVGLIRDEGLANVKRRWLVAISGVAALGLILVAFFAQNIILSFHVELVTGAPLADCAAALSDGPVAFFKTCHRAYLKLMTKIALGLGVVSLGSIAIWFLLQFGRQTNEKDPDPVGRAGADDRRRDG